MSSEQHQFEHLVHVVIRFVTFQSIDEQQNLENDPTFETTQILSESHGENGNDAIVIDARTLSIEYARLPVGRLLLQRFASIDVNELSESIALSLDDELSKYILSAELFQFR